eukprot:CAMPEP_0182896066 /NCGR_PEP_ID=MMETSP0034_2-20130328/26055_1 /TAXON_ID=156128 /ORGANISM="Nephroselmis pyriformis, Strain CCMP717" /LENGTH=266 /DNA_ID=CAMNT_0025029923 /DNA_START=11 /DNA_END=807 /DNA_ORIENTATION=-
MDVVARGIRRPRPYDKACRRTVDTNRLQSLVNWVNHTMTLPQHMRQPLEDNVCKEIRSNEDVLRIFLAPFLHGARYTSYGRHFTVEDVLDKITDSLLPRLRGGDTVVDFSCGSNDFLKGLCAKAEAQGFSPPLQPRSYDIVTTRHQLGFELRSWFDVKVGELGRGENLVIGLNPPFGVRASLAKEFMIKAAAHAPRIIALVVPPSTIRPLPAGYRVILHDDKLCSNRCFYIPGTSHQSWNKETPPFILLERTAPYPAFKRVAPPPA